MSALTEEEQAIVDRYLARLPEGWEMDAVPVPRVDAERKLALTAVNIKFRGPAPFPPGKDYHRAETISNFTEKRMAVCFAEFLSAYGLKERAVA
jgi:hypothetical protein